MTTPQFHSPGKPDCRMVELVHRGHDGFVSFNVKKHDDGRRDPFQSLVSLPANSLPGLFGQVISDLETDGFFAIHGMYRGHYGKNRKGYVADDGTPLPNSYRESAGVRWLTANFVDLDCKKLGLEPGTVIGEVIRLQDAGVIPPASLITRSGNGVWLFWILSDDHGKPIRGHDSTIVKWSRVQAAILGRFARFGSDTNAADAARGGGVGRDGLAQRPVPGRLAVVEEPRAAPAEPLREEPAPGAQREGRHVRLAAAEGAGGERVRVDGRADDLAATRREGHAGGRGRRHGRADRDRGGDVAAVPHPALQEALGHQLLEGLLDGGARHAELPGQQQINVTRMIVDPDLPNVNLWSRVLWRGVVWDVVSPPQYHHGATRHVRHWSLDLRERP